MQKDLRPDGEQFANEFDELPAKLGKPARRALIQAGYTRLEQLSKLTETEMAKLHGMGPKAIEQIRAALAAAGKSFANSDGAAKATDERLIQELLEKWATATRFGKSDEVLANHASDVTIFDVLPPMKYEGAEAYRITHQHISMPMKEGKS